MKKMYLLAAISAIICGFLLYSFMGDMKTETATIEIERRPAVIAVNDIPAFADLTEDMFTVVELPAEGLHADAVTDVSEIMGKKSANSFVANEVILRSKLDQDIEGFSSYAIPEGMRVMTVSVSLVSGIAQSITEGDKFDVIYSAFNQKEEKKEENDDNPYGEPKEEEKDERADLSEGVKVNQSVTSTLLENVEVFRTGSALQADGVEYETVDLLLTPQQCLRVYAALNYGAISLTLRAHKDASPANTTLVYAADILNDTTEITD